MSRVAVVSGSVSILPSEGAQGGMALLPLAGRLPVGKLGSIEFDLTDATETAVTLPSDGVKFLLVRVVGGEVVLKITSDAGAAQVVPCADYFLLSCITPITALTVTRGAGVGNLVAVQVHHGQA